MDIIITNHGIMEKVTDIITNQGTMGNMVDIIVTSHGIMGNTMDIITNHGHHS